MNMDTQEKYIGIFDSGIGGLTVVKSIVEKMPGENIIYFGDTAHVPYGSRSKEQIRGYVLADVEFLSQFNLKAIVIACNTADSIARGVVEEKYGDIPVFGVVEPASKKAARETKNNKIGVIATTATVGSGSYERTIGAFNPDAQVFSLACPLLVPLVEAGRINKGDDVIEEVLEEYLSALMEKEIDTLVLGCTHYPLLTELIRDTVGENVKIISSSVAAAETIYAKMDEMNILSSSSHGDRKFFVSDNPEYFGKQAKIFMGSTSVVPKLWKA